MHSRVSPIWILWTLTFSLLGLDLFICNVCSTFSGKTARIHERVNKLVSKFEPNIKFSSIKSQNYSASSWILHVDSWFSCELILGQMLILLHCSLFKFCVPNPSERLKNSRKKTVFFIQKLYLVFVWKLDPKELRQEMKPTYKYLPMCSLSSSKQRDYCKNKSFSTIINKCIEIKMSPYRSVIVLAVFILSLTWAFSGLRPVAAARLLAEEENELVRFLGFVLESLPQGPTTPSGPSGCTHGPATGGRCPPWAKVSEPWAQHLFTIDLFRKLMCFNLCLVSFVNPGWFDIVDEKWRLELEICNISC